MFLNRDFVQAREIIQNLLLRILANLSTLLKRLDLGKKQIRSSSELLSNNCLEVSCKGDQITSAQDINWERNKDN